MPRRTITFHKGNYYHIYHRGKNRTGIFYEEENYIYFLSLLHRYFPIDEIRIHAYCLMVNHFHILAELISECNISRCTKNLLIAYTKGMNKRYRRAGHLFHGQFGCTELNSDLYALALTKCIHSDPVTAGLAAKGEDWKYSSYRTYLRIDIDPWVSTALMKKYFTSVDEYREFVAADFRGLSDFGSQR